MIRVLWFTASDQWYASVYDMLDGGVKGDLLMALGPYTTKAEALKESEEYVKANSPHGLSNGVEG